MPVALAPSPSSPRSALIRQDAPQSATSPVSQQDAIPTPQVQVNGKPASAAVGSPSSPRASLSSGSGPPASDGTGWGANFWVTLVDPQVRDCPLHVFDVAHDAFALARLACPFSPALLPEKSAGIRP